MTKWTIEQQEAINKEGVNIIVSAGAGSGKTAVLTERVIRKLKSGVNINELLILTFTNAAAVEMQDRIRDAIKKDESLIKQLSLIDGAYITTFDSFALLMVKKYHYLLNITSNIEICDSSLIYIKKKDLIDEIFNEMYESKNENFLEMINDFCIKNDNDIKKYILNVNNKLDLKYDKNLYLSNYVSNYFNSNKITSDINNFVTYLKENIILIKENINNLSNYVDSNYINSIDDLLYGLINSNTYSEIVSNLEIKLPPLPKNSSEEAKKYKEDINDIIKYLKSICIYKDEKFIYDSILSTKPYVESIIEIINKLDQKINIFKQENNNYEFNDISKMAIDILKNNGSVCEELKSSFKEIMIDEYQDTSDLQETFISMIENNNIYQVGDIKQSIYRFRNANPYIFKTKYDEYSKNNGGYKIDLNKNFRSRKETLDNINVVFNIIMDDMIGGADYRKSHQMIFGNNSYIEKGTTNQNNNFEIYDYKYDKSSNYTKEEIEAFIIVSDIKSKINSKYQVFDKKTSMLRDCKYSDFVILMDRVKHFDLYKKIFEYMNVPLTKKADTSITNSIDFMLIKNIIGLIINVYNSDNSVLLKYNFISVARSYLFRYSDEEIFDYIENNKIYTSKIIEIVKEITLNLESKSISEIIDLIIDKFNFYENLIKVGDVNLSLTRLEYIYNLGNVSSGVGYSIFEFYNYLSKLIEENIPIKVDISENTLDSVKIMNIHKSKGLEFPICYYSLLHAPFNISDRNERILYSEKYGIITPFFNEGIANSIYKILFSNDYLKEEISEKIRLFYVALTRCREKMIIVTSLDDASNIDGDLVPTSNRLKYKSFLDILNSVYSNLVDYLLEINLNSLPLTKNYNLIKSTNYNEMIEKSNSILEKRNINIENNIKEKHKFSKNTSSLIDNNTRNNMKYGEYIHYVFEVINFKNPDYSIIDNKCSKYIDNFLHCGIDFLNCNIYKEYEFMYNDDGNIYKGIIDLMLEYDKEIKIIDYKLSDTTDSNYVEQLNGYRKYIKNKTNKDAKIYLYSILKNELKELD